MRRSARARRRRRDAERSSAATSSRCARTLVVIAASTHRLGGGLFEYEDLGALEVKGFSKPLRAWRVLRETAVES